MNRALHVSALMLLLLTACGKDEPDLPASGERALITRSFESRVSDGDYTVAIEIDVAAGVDAFLVTGTSSEAFVGVEEVYDPDGDLVLFWEDWNGADESLTNAVYEDTVSTLNWPVRAEDGPLEPGTWTVLMTTTNDALSYITDAPVDVSVHRRAGKPADGVVRVRVVYARGLDQDDEIVGAVEAAVDRWTEVWDARSMRIEVTYESSELNPSLDFAYDGSAAARAVAAADDEPGVVMIIGERFPDDLSTYGFSSGLPGALEATERSYVTVSWLAHAGTDARFSDDEKRIMGETMAHECGHYLGLYHPVESDYDAWDALGDTARCTGEDACDSALGSNNMFPYTVCSRDSCLPQGDLTDDQVAVAQGWTGVR